MKRILILSILTFAIVACNAVEEPETETKKALPAEEFVYTPSQEHKDYWFNGTAEISSYAISQARYGELREGQAAMIFVTEPFSLESNTKADPPSANDPSVLKLNFTKKFNTGIYPYSMMNSSFFPFENGKHSLKVSTSVQEWCGHVYMELKNKEQFDISIDSYFEGESKSAVNLDKNLLEDDLWSMIRLQSDKLPLGEQMAVPGFFYLRLKHVPAKAYAATTALKETDSINRFSIQYPELNRSLEIRFESAFPHRILGWTEKHPKGFGSSELIESTGKLLKSIRSDYWRRNRNADASLRDTLGLR